MPPVLLCFADQDSRVRYYACESMYNIAKVARGSILRYFNELFDAMSKVHKPRASWLTTKGSKIWITCADV